MIKLFITYLVNVVGGLEAHVVRHLGRLEYSVVGH